MTDGTVGNLGQWVTAVGTRRGALAALLAGSAGVKTAQGRNASAAKRKKKGKKGKKGKSKNHHGAGDTSLPHVTYSVSQRAIPNQTGSINISAICPTGTAPIAGVWTVEHVDGASLITQDILLTQPPAWEVSVLVPTGSPHAVIELIAICLDATFNVVEE
jgi:hypothetical protein